MMDDHTVSRESLRPQPPYSSEEGYGLSPSYPPYPAYTYVDGIPDKMMMMTMTLDTMCSMDTDIVNSAPDVERANGNDAHSSNSCEGDEANAAEMLNGVLDRVQISDDNENAISEVHSESKECDINDPSAEEVKDEECEQTNGTLAPGKVDVQETQDGKNSKIQNIKGRSNARKPVNSMTSGPVAMKKTNSGKELKVSLNGASSASSRPKQQVLKSTKSFNDGGRGKVTKSTLAATNAAKTKQPAKTQSSSSNDNASVTSGPVEKTKLKPVRKAALPKFEGDEESVGSPTSTDSKPRREGKLPSYSFSFRCYERAEKRKEFYTKLEERIHAKEEEMCNKEAKSKETQEAEIRMLRKSLNFKATPMPTFYQEPPPPKVEPKKIPTTRPKSPKLGRRKSSSPAGTEPDVIHNHPKGRLSLNEKVSHHKSAKSSSLAPPQKPQGKSLPRLPSEKTTLPKTTNKPLAPVHDATNGTIQKELEAGASEPRQTENTAEPEPMSKPDGAPEQEQVTVEQ